MTNPMLLVLRLEGPMQAWGLRSRWDLRDTGTEPSKSAVVGILGAALGYRRGDPRLEERLDASLAIGVREERAGIIAEDFQTVTGTHVRAQGDVVDKTIVSPRSYIQDAAFLVIISGPAEMLKECEAALRAPVWPLFLGRKSCPPTRPMLVGLTDQYASLRDALEKLPWESPVETKAPPARLRCVVEDLAGIATRPDAFKVNPARMYGDRHIEVVFVENPSTNARGDP